MISKGVFSQDHHQARGNLYSVLNIHQTGGICYENNFMISKSEIYHGDTTGWSRYGYGDRDQRRHEDFINPIWMGAATKHLYISLTCIPTPFH